MTTQILTNFQPRRREISAVSNATQALITTTEDHGYWVDLIVRLFIPKDYGMILEYVQRKILTIPAATQFTVDIDTSANLTYVIPTEPPSFTQSHVVPVSGIEDNETSITG